MVRLTDEELLETLEKQLPALLERHPELEMRVYGAFMRTFATKEEVAAVLSELRAFRGDFDAFRSEVRERFEHVDARFEQVDARFEQVDARFDRIEQGFSDLRDWVELVVGRLQTRSGRNLENVVAGALRLALQREDIVPEKIRLRQKIEDTEGMIGPAGREYEVDILTEDGRLLVFEVKSVCEVEDVDRLADKVALVRAMNPGKAVEGVMVALEPEAEVQARCAKWEIELVS